MSSERNALLDKTYPELQAFCHSLGLVFEVVDMRWGLQDAIAVDHMTTELCLLEIEACKKVSVGPSFIVSVVQYCSSSTGVQLRSWRATGFSSNP
uniref:Uncharacterized protein n=1 Tax=Salmo trutta TaxID=8032 RepID=A0A673WII3_SALTR